jgi:dTMP kinase
MTTEFGTEREQAAPEQTTGKLVSLAGMDGAGKTTQARLLGQWLRDRGHTVAIEAPPGPSLVRRTLADLAEQRGVADHQDVFGPDVTHLIQAFMRLRDWTERVVPALPAHDWVVTDRSPVCHYAATISDGGTNEADLRLLLRRLPRPDLTLYLELSPEEAQARLTARGSGLEDTTFLRANDRAYRALPEFTDFVVVPGDGPVEQVQARLRGALHAKFLA